MTYVETRTQEDIAELHAQHGLGCKACEQHIEPGTAFACEGDIYCAGCAYQLRREGVAWPHLLPRRADAASAAPAAPADELPAEPAAPADELYGCTGAAAQWIRDNVGLN